MEQSQWWICWGPVSCEYSSAMHLASLTIWCWVYVEHRQIPWSLIITEQLGPSELGVFLVLFFPTEPFTKQKQKSTTTAKKTTATPRPLQKTKTKATTTAQQQQKAVPRRYYCLQKRVWEEGWSLIRVIDMETRRLKTTTTGLARKVVCSSGRSSSGGSTVLKLRRITDDAVEVLFYIFGFWFF